MGRRTRAIMHRLDGLLRNRSESRNRGAHSRGASREPRVNFIEHTNRGRTYGSTRRRGVSYGNVTDSNRQRNPTNIRGDSISSRPISNERPTRDAHVRRKGDSIKWNHSNQGRTQPRDSDKREFPDPQTTEMTYQAGYSWNRSLETFLTKLFRTNERSETFKWVCSRSQDVTRMHPTVV